MPVLCTLLNLNAAERKLAARRRFAGRKATWNDAPQYQTGTSFRPIDGGGFFCTSVPALRKTIVNGNWLMMVGDPQMVDG